MTHTKKFDLDLKFGKMGEEFTEKVFEGNSKVEVKTERDIWVTTGNIAIEIYNPKSGKPSGLTATKATLWCQVLQDSVWITSVKALRKFCEETPPFKMFSSAGDGNAAILLYRTEDILTIFERIDECNSEQLQALINQQLR